MDMAFDPKDNLKMMNVGLSEGNEGGHTSVRGSLSPYLWFKSKRGDPVVLVSSTRYEKEALVEFAGAFGWRLLREVSSPSAPGYFQFLFERTSSDKIE